MIAPSKCAALLAVAAMASGVDAHGKMILPAPTCSGGYCSNSPSGTIDGPNTIPVPAGMSYGTDPTSNMKAFQTAFKGQTKYKSLKDLALSDAVKTESGASKECGYSSVTGTAQPLPENVEWDKFDLSHTGPCEVWCDDVMVFQDDSCSVNLTTQPAVLKYDKSKCVGKKMLTSFWIALHVPQWQIYTNCAPIAGGASSGGSSATTPSTSSTPASTTKAPAASTTPASTTKAPAASTTPASTTKAPSTPAATTKAPSSGGSTKTPAPAATKKCKAKTRRN
ncbi:hypothetical protein Gpo141_00011548 [Globisporangium polare]